MSARQVLPIAWVVALAALAAGPAMAHPPASAHEYRWVNPPSWAPTDVPRAQERAVEVGPDLFVAGVADVWTPDAQAVVRITGSPPDGTPARVRITPLDPAGLAPPVEAGGLPNGNAYRVAVAAESWEPVDLDLALSTPFAPTGVVALVDGTWTPLQADMVAGLARVAIPSEIVVMALADRVDGHDNWWDTLAHDPLRLGLLVAALAAIVLRLAVFRRRAVRRAGPGRGSGR